MSQRTESPEVARLRLLEKIGFIQNDLDFLDTAFSEFQNKDKKSAESILDSMREPLNEIESEIESEYKMITNGTLQIDNHYSKNRDINSIKKCLDDFKRGTNSLCSAAFDNPEEVYFHLNEKRDNYLSKLNSLKEAVLTPEFKYFKEDTKTITKDLLKPFNNKNQKARPENKRGIIFKPNVQYNPLTLVKNIKNEEEKNKPNKEKTK